MARSSETDPINQLEENLKCSVCLEALKDPRTLPCFHSFCKDCLEGVVKTCRDKARRDRGPVREFPCPDCRTMFTLEPDKHVADMPRNHFICNMVQVAAVLDRGTRVPCSHNCSQSFSVARCVTCEKFLCRECLTGHNNYRGNNGHSVLTMEELSKPENRTKINGTMYCNEHSGMPLKVYCETCDKLICKDCMDFKHVKQNHSCLLVKDVASNYKERLASNNKAMEDVLNVGNVFLQQLSLKMARLDSNVEKAKSEIVQSRDAMAKKVVAMLNLKAETLLTKVGQIHGDKREQLDKQTKEMQSYVENIKQSVQLSKTLVHQGTEEEIISSQKMILDNANNLLPKAPKYFKAPIPDVKVNYTSSASKEALNKEIVEAMANSLEEVNDDNETACSSLTGDQPDGMMYDGFETTHLPGFPSCDTIVISYQFPNGIQGPNHPRPGKPYEGTAITAYLPFNEEGRKVHRLLKKAFEQKLTFTIGWLITTGMESVVTWNGIHHKTSMTGGPLRNGYPDSSYLKIVQKELAAKGITE